MCRLCKIDGLNGFSRTNIWKESSNIYDVRYVIVKNFRSGEYSNMVQIFDKNSNDILFKNSVKINYCPYCGKSLRLNKK